MKTGDYVRTECGIDKVACYRYEPEYENGHVVLFEKTNSGTRYTDENLPKSSPNIIDLIEVGDYVNGYMVKAKDEKENKVYFDYLKKSYPANIETVLTKEQFESMKYEVK